VDPKGGRIWDRNRAVQVRPNGRAVHDIYVFKMKSPQESKGKYDFYQLVETLPPEQAFRPLAEGGCPLVK
jgi:branched-chain amino acid transport system substrate-binding protein